MRIQASAPRGRYSLWTRIEKLTLRAEGSLPDQRFLAFLYECEMQGRWDRMAQRFEAFVRRVNKEERAKL